MDDNAQNDLEEKSPKKSSPKKKSGRVEELEQKIKDLEGQLLRSIADYRNLEKRVEDEKREFVKFANKDLLASLLPAFDTLFLAEKYVEDESVKLTIRYLHEVLKNVGVERIAAQGQFNPEVMEAVATDQGEENEILEELRPGYTLNGKLIRPTQVKVGKSATRD